MDAAEVKRLGKGLGADMTGIISAKTLNAIHPDPQFPQTPERISPYVKSFIVVVQHITVAAFRAMQTIPMQYIYMLVLRRMDKITYRLAKALEKSGFPSFVTAAPETDWDYKKASYGRLSTRHLGNRRGSAPSGSRSIS